MRTLAPHDGRREVGGLDLGFEQLQKNRKLGRIELPGDWLPIIGQEARRARGDATEALSRNQADHAEAGVWRNYLDRFGGPMAAQLSDAQIKGQAAVYAREASELEIGELLNSGELSETRRLLQFCKAREVAPPSDLLDLAGRGARVRCPYWWRRALRKRIARKAEAGSQMMGLVSAPNHQPYASNFAVLRRIEQNARNSEALKNITLENDEGYRRTLAELSATSTSNKAIRRGELMTRIRGCEEIADACGHPGIFVTGTTPSRFHATLRNGNRNPKFAGATPRDAQAWLNDKWQKTRAKAARQGIKVYGFRVAEPHHDGCPHWHMLLWSAGDLGAWGQIFGDYWLSDAGDEPGAAKYRTNIKAMAPGGAAGYIAKYISKNIDDHEIDVHHDADYESGDAMEIGPDLLGDLEVKPSMRVEAWASTWGIRQFQALGQPPVTVWRELRRITEANAKAAGFNGIVHKAWLAAQKIAGVPASWQRYVMAQGGMNQGRAARLCMRHDRREVEGLYGLALRNLPIGVALNCRGARTVWSERRLWRAVDRIASVPAPVCESDKRSASARTGVNNCTQGGKNETTSAHEPGRNRLDLLQASRPGPADGAKVLDSVGSDPLSGQSWTIATDKSGSWTTGITEKNTDPDGFRDY